MKVLRSLMLVVLMLTSFDATATILCANNGNELNIALEQFATQIAEDTEIRVTMGTHTSNYHAPQAAQFSTRIWLGDLSEDLTISGGWSTGNNCATQVSLNPSATVLDALLHGPVFAIQFGDDRFEQGQYTGTFTLKNMTLNRGKGFAPFQETGLVVAGWLGSPGSIVLENLHVVNGTSAAASGHTVIMNFWGSGSIRFRNNVVSLNSLTGSNAPPVLIQAGEAVVAYVSNNSIFENSGTYAAAGLLFRGGAGTLTNNVVVDNISTANPSYQFFSDAPTGLTLVKNHFGTEGWVNGAPFSETGTTFGNAFWAPLGVERIPLEGSPLRDSGNNTPTGGALAIDFSGKPRIVNTTMDRGASEAPAPSNPALGPIVTDNTPVKGSTTWLRGEVGQSAFGEITFGVSAGEPGGLTLIECQVTSGTVLIGAYPSQYVATGQAAQPVLVGFDNLSETEQTGVVFCTFKRSGIPGSTFAAYTFKSGLDQLFKNGFE